jgi:hypothetical protein
MPLEIHVRCEYPKCDEAEVAAKDAGRQYLGQIVDRLDGDHFHFVVDSDWTDAPEGWRLGPNDEILCPKHAPVEAEPPRGDAHRGISP